MARPSTGDREPKARAGERGSLSHFGIFVTRGDYRIRVAGSAPALVLVKLSWYPGFELRDATGREFPLVPVAGGMAGVGRGEMTLRYQRTPRMKLGYGLSLVEALWLGKRAWQRRRAPAPTPSRPVTV